MKMQIQTVLILLLTMLWLTRLLKNQKMVYECDFGGNSIVKCNFLGNFGRYEQKLYTKDTSQELLKNLKFTFDEPAKIKLT
jgi:hypothetical protein